MWLNISNGTILTLPSLIFGVFDAILTTKQILEETNIITSPTDVILEQLEIINDKLEGNKEL